MSSKSKSDTKSARQKKADSDFTFNAAAWMMRHNPCTVEMDIQDKYWCETLLGIAPVKLTDLTGIFLRNHDVYADEAETWGPPKWKYSEDDYDSFDCYLRNGCKSPFLEN